MLLTRDIPSSNLSILATFLSRVFAPIRYSLIYEFIYLLDIIPLLFKVQSNSDIPTPIPYQYSSRSLAFRAEGNRNKQEIMLSKKCFFG